MPRRFEPLVLCYHAVSSNWRHGLSVELAELERQLETFLAQGYRPAGVDEVLGGAGKLIHVTFDDAYRSVASALPVLDRLGVAASVFACAGYADEGRPLDVPELAEQARRYPGELATMDWAGLRRLAEQGVEVGSHTVSHPHLTELSDARLADELRESRRRIAAELGRPCRLLAYPYGEQDERVRAAARAAGYEAAFALPGRVRTPDRFALPRVGIWRKDTALRVRLKSMPLVRHSAELLARS